MTRKQTITFPIKFDLDGVDLARALAAHAPHITLHGGYRDLDRHEAHDAIATQIKQGGTYRLLAFSAHNTDDVAESVRWAVSHVRRLWPDLDGPDLAAFDAKYTP